MLELLRTFLGYCQNCRRPAIVGEFKLQGWQHVFNLCDHCVGGMKEKLVAAETDLANRMLAETHGSRI